MYLGQPMNFSADSHILHTLNVKNIEISFFVVVLFNPIILSLRGIRLTLQYLSSLQVTCCTGLHGTSNKEQSDF